MNFEFSRDQQLLGEQARDFLQKECSPTAVRQIVDGDESYDQSLWKKIAELGWLGTVIPEEYDGLGLSYLELAIIAEELGRSLAPVPFSSTVYLATELLLLAGSEKQKQHWLPSLATGNAIGTVAVASSNACTRSSERPTVSATNSVLQGEMRRTPDAQLADFCIVLGSEGTDESLFLVDMRQDGVSTMPASSIDLTRNVGDVVLANTQADRLGERGQGKQHMDKALQRAAVLFAWEQLGGSDVALEQARDYALERFAFGRPIGSFQSIKHKLAQAYVKNTLARSNCYYGIWALDNNAADLERAAAAARVSATQAYYYSSKENIHTHGGMGFTWEFDCHLYYRRAKALSVCVGGETAWKKRLVSTLKQGSDAPQAGTK